MAEIEKRIDDAGIFIKEIDLFGYRADVFESNDKEMISILWNDGVYVYWIISNYEIDTVIEIAKSVKTP